MDPFSIVKALAELIGAIDAYSTSRKNLAESLKTLKDELTSTRDLFEQLEELVREESGDTTTTSTSINFTYLDHCYTMLCSHDRDNNAVTSGVK